MGRRPSSAALVEKDELLRAVGIEETAFQRLAQRFRAEVIVGREVGAISRLFRANEQALPVKILDLHPDAIAAALRAEMQEELRELEPLRRAPHELILQIVGPWPVRRLHLVAGLGPEGRIGELAETEVAVLLRDVPDDGDHGDLKPRIAWRELAGDDVAIDVDRIDVEIAEPGDAELVVEDREPFVVLLLARRLLRGVVGGVLVKQDRAAKRVADEGD